MLILCLCEGMYECVSVYNLFLIGITGKIDSVLVFKSTGLAGAFINVRLIRWTFLAVFPGVILGVLHELFLILEKLLGQFGAQWMLGFGFVD